MKPENRLKNIEEELAHSRESIEAAKVLVEVNLARGLLGEAEQDFELRRCRSCVDNA